MKKAQHTRKEKALPPPLTPGNHRLPLSKRCTATARTGERCQSAPMRGKKKCLLHTGDNASKMGIKGGHRRTIFDPDGLVAFDPPETAADLKKLFARSIIEIRAAKLDPKLANSISYLGMGFLKALDLSDHEARLTAIEKQLSGDQG
jgi:hypothetical protein